MKIIFDLENMFNEFREYRFKNEYNNIDKVKFEVTKTQDFYLKNVLVLVRKNNANIEVPLNLINSFEIKED